LQKLPKLKKHKKPEKLRQRLRPRRHQQLQVPNRVLHSWNKRKELPPIVKTEETEVGKESKRWHKARRHARPDGTELEKEPIHEPELPKRRANERHAEHNSQQV